MLEATTSLPLIDVVKIVDYPSWRGGGGDFEWQFRESKTHFYD